MSSPDNPNFEPTPSSERPVLTVEVPRDSGETPGLPSSIVLPRDPVWGGWDVLLIALMTVGNLLLVEEIIRSAARILLNSRPEFREFMQNPSLDLVGQFLGYILVAVCMVVFIEGKYHVQFWRAIRWNWHGNAVPKFLGLGVLTVGIDFLGHFLPMPKSTPFDELFSHRRDAYLIAVLAITLGPLMEELFFRGLLYPVLARRAGIFLAVLFTSLPFGLMHYLQYRSWAAVLLVTLVGVVLTLVRVVTNSVAACFLVHVGYNGTLMMITALATDGFRHLEKAILAGPFWG